MIYLFLVACILLGAGEIWRSTVSKKRAQRVLEYIQMKFPDVYGKKFAASKVGDRELTEFLQSPETLGDPALGELKKQAVFASKVAMMPLLVMLGLMMALYVSGAVMSFFK